MAKKSKTVDLKPKADKISAEHLKEMQDVINVINNIHTNSHLIVNKTNDII